MDKMNKYNKTSLSSYINQENIIQNKIYTIRGMQVMLDRDLANLYDVKPIRLREQVRRNSEKFPMDFMFELNSDEVDFMVSQNAIPSKKHLGGSLPLVFTEQGVSMLPSVLKSTTATEISIKIIRTFVNMRKFLQSNASIFQRLDNIETKQIQNRLESDSKFDKIFKAIEDKEIKPKQLELDLKRYNSQYAKIDIKKFNLSHDRFLIIDDKDIYHIGASLEDLDKKWFAVSKMDMNSLDIINRLEKA